MLGHKHGRRALAGRLRDREVQRLALINEIALSGLYVRLQRQIITGRAGALVRHAGGAVACRAWPRRQGWRTTLRSINRLTAPSPGLVSVPKPRLDQGAHFPVQNRSAHCSIRPRIQQARGPANSAEERRQAAALPAARALGAGKSQMRV